MGPRLTSTLACLLFLGVAAPVSPLAADERPIRIRLVGDVAVVGTMRDEMLAHGLDPFAELGTAISRADLAIANLEATLTTRERPPQPLDDEEAPILRSPPRTAECLARAGFDLVSMANNHVLDFGPRGLAETLGHVRAAGLVPMGAGTTPEEARALHVSTIRGVRIGVLAVANNTNQHPAGEGYVGRLRYALERVRATQASVDVLIVYVHWGVQYEARPEREQRELARALVDAGADAVIGHHPHVLQTVEHHHGKPIVYSLGNFVFGPQPAPRDISAIAELVVDERAIVSLRMIPVILRGTVGSPVVEVGAHGERARVRLRPGMAWLERDGVLELALGRALASR